MTPSSVALAEITAYLDEYLRVREVPDDPNALNGLQVQNGGTISRIVAAVDASLTTIEGAARIPQSETTARETLLLVHHGLFWDGNVPLTGRRYRRVRALLEQDTALYSAHIPLDLHPEVGNNAVLARRLGLMDMSMFGTHGGVAIGFAGTAPDNLQTRPSLIMALASTLCISPSAIHLLPGGQERIKRIGVITGAAGSAIAQAHAAGCDAYITGEGAAHTYFDAMELGINVLYAGHYATETVGVQALATHVADRFGLPWGFHDHPTGL